MKNLLIFAFTFCTLLPCQNEINQTEIKGFNIGFGIGVGVISISDSDQEIPYEEAQGGSSFPNFKLGWMVNVRLAILGLYSGMSNKYEKKGRSFDALMSSVQYRIKDRWWINADAGLAMDFPAIYVDTNKDKDWIFGGAVAFSTGDELVQEIDFALDFQTQLQMVWTNWDNNKDGYAVVFSIGLGFNWF